jgi:hypothetical protein
MINEAHKNFDIDKYNKFIQKYKKSDYLSKRNLKTMKEIGIEYSFPRIYKNVENCISFFKKQNEELLEDLLIEIKHDFNCDFVYIDFYLEIRNEFPLSNLKIHINTDDIKELTDLVIKDVDKTVNSKIEKVKNKKGSWEEFVSKRLREYEFIDKLKVYPCLNLKLGFQEIDSYSQDDRKRVTDNYYKVRDVLKDEIAPRYLNAIGYNQNYHINPISIDYIDYSYYFDIITYI